MDTSDEGLPDSIKAWMASTSKSYMWLPIKELDYYQTLFTELNMGLNAVRSFETDGREVSFWLKLTVAGRGYILMGSLFEGGYSLNKE